MPDNRFYTPSPLHQGETITLSKEESLHLTQVMRHRTGDQVEVCNGLGELALCEIIAAKKREVKLLVESYEKQEKPKCTINLFQAYLQPTHLELVIEKGTELGADTFFLFPAHKSHKKSYSDNQVRRLHTITINSMKQCGRLYLPKIEWIESLVPFDHPTFFGSLEENIPPLWEVFAPSPTHLQFLVGPESGWTNEEEENLKELGAKPVTLHQNTLRAETAAVVALSHLATQIPKTENARSKPINHF